MAEFEADTATTFGLKVQCGDESCARIVYDRRGEQLIVSRPTSGIIDFAPVSNAPLVIQDGRITLRILLDESSVEVFAGDGTIVLTSRLFTNTSHAGIRLFATGGTAQLVRMDIYAIERIW